MITTILEILLAILISGSILKPFLDDYPFREWRRMVKDKEQKKFRTSAFVAMLGMVCAALSFVISLQNNASLNKELAQLQDVNNIQLSQIDALRDDNLELSEELTVKSVEIVKTITGGDSYCYLMVFFPQEKNTIQVNLIHKGEYPLYNIQIGIEDLGTRRLLMDEIQLNPQIEPSSYGKYFKDILKKTTYRINVGDLPVGSLVSFDEMTLSEHLNRFSWIVRISANNGHFYQRIEIVDLWEKNRAVAMRLEKDGEILIEEITNDFPNDELKSF